MRYVVDSNVAVVASGRATHANLELQAKSAKFLYDVMQSGDILEDCEDLALGEYRKYLNFSGQPTIGDEFLVWFLRSRWSGNGIVRVSAPLGGSILGLLPERLRGFDSDDHKWICIFLAGNADWIVNAVDSDWEDAAPLLLSEGVKVLELSR